MLVKLLHKMGSIFECEGLIGLSEDARGENIIVFQLYPLDYKDENSIYVLEDIKLQVS